MEKKIDEMQKKNDSRIVDINKKIDDMQTRIENKMDDTNKTADITSTNIEEMKTEMLDMKKMIKEIKNLLKNK